MVISLYHKVENIKSAIKGLEYNVSIIERYATNNFDKCVARDLRENIRRLNGELMRLISTAEDANKGNINIII